MGSIVDWVFGRPWAPPSVDGDDSAEVGRGANMNNSSGDDEGSCIVINLDTAKDRYNAFLRAFQHSDLKKLGLSRYSAVKGADLDIASMVTPLALQEIRAGSANGYRRNHYELTVPAVGCYMSHVGVWTRLLNSGRPYFLVMEDDALIPSELVAQMESTIELLPRGWDILLLGYVLTKFNIGLYYHHVHRFYCLHAYVITRRGVEKIMAAGRVFPIAMQIDTMLSDITDEGLLNVYATPRPLVRQNNMVFGTSVQTPVRSDINRLSSVA